MMAQCIRVLVVDEHSGVRHAIGTFVTAVEDLELAGQAASGEEAIRLCAYAQPDVVLMDVSLPDMTGAAATQALLRCWPEARIVAMGSFQEEDQMQGAIEAGAVGCILKNVSADELGAAIRAAYTSSSSSRISGEPHASGQERNGTVASGLGDQPHDGGPLNEAK